MLVLLMVVIMLGRTASTQILAGAARRTAKRAAASDTASRDKALAAVVAVSALLAGTASVQGAAVEDV